MYWPSARTVGLGAAGGERQDRHQRVGRVRREVLPRVDGGRRLRPGPGGEEVRGAAHGRDLQRQARDDAELAAAPAAEGPEQVGVVARVDGAQPSVGGDHRQGHHVVAGEAELPAGQAVPAALGEAGDAHVGAGAGGDRAARGGQLGVDVDQLGAGADDDRAARPSEGDRADAAQVELHAAAGGRVAGVRVAAGARDERDAGAGRPAHGRAHVGDVGRPRDGERAQAVVALVVDQAAQRRSRRRRGCGPGRAWRWRAAAGGRRRRGGCGRRRAAR